MLKSNYYSSIDDLPLHNWRRCTEDQEYKYARIDVDNGSDEEDAAAWALIYDSFLKEFGLGKDYERILELTKEIAIAQCEYVEDAGEFLRNKIKHLQMELDDLLNKPVEQDMDEVIIWMEKWRGISIDEKTITVRKFYKILQAHKKEADRINQQSKKNG